jgi:hypothetical protein
VLVAARETFIYKGLQLGPLADLEHVVAWRNGASMADAVGLRAGPPSLMAGGGQRDGRRRRTGGPPRQAEQALCVVQVAVTTVSRWAASASLVPDALMSGSARRPAAAR